MELRWAAETNRWTSVIAALWASLRGSPDW